MPPLHIDAACIAQDERRGKQLDLSGTALRSVLSQQKWETRLGGRGAVVRGAEWNRNRVRRGVP